MLGIAVVGAVITTGKLFITNAVARTDTARLYEIYEHWGHFSLDAPPPEMTPIILQVPSGFGYASSGKRARNWGFNILTYYPSFTSPDAPENAAFGLDCKGDCNGRMLVAINNRAHSINNPNRFDAPNMGDYIARVDLQQPTPLRAVKNDVKILHGFDTAYEIQLSAGNGTGERSDQYFFHFSPDKRHYDVAAKCSLNEFARACTLHFSLRCNPAIYVQVVAINMKYIDAWTDIVQKTDQFVSSMVRAPACR